MAKEEIMDMFEDEVIAQTEEESLADTKDDEDEIVETKLPAMPSKSGVLSTTTDLDFDFGGMQNLPGVVVGDIGVEISRFPVERAKFTKDSKALISIVSSKVVAVKTHYREGLGSYLCFGGACCDKDGLARIKYLFPVNVYDTDRKGSPVSKDLQRKVLAIGSDQYEDIRTMMELNGDITAYDILVTCKDEKYQKISFTLAGTARWRKSKKMMSDTVEFWREHMKDIIKPVAREITESDLEKSNAADVDTRGDINFDDVFDDE